MKKQLIAISTVTVLGGMLALGSCKKSDVTAPILTITGGNTQTASLNAPFSNPAATATDDVDGNVTSKISILNPTAVDNNTKAAYTLHYSVSDASGNTATQDVVINIVNDAEWLAGTYTVVDSVYNISPLQSGLPWVTPYPGTPNENITTDNNLNNKFWVTEFGAHTGGAVYMTVTGTGAGAAINIPSQSVICGSPSALRTFSNDTQTPAGTVYMFGTRPGFLLYYKEVISANSSTANSTGRYLHD